MAKKKEEVVESTGNKTDDFIRSLQKELGYGVVNADQFMNREVVVIPISPAIDGITGGIPEGSWAIFSGKAKAGKTTTALKFASNAQKEEWGSRHVFFLNCEGRLKKMNLNCVDLKQDKFTIIESTEDKILSAQDYLNIAEKILLNNKKIILIIDSYSILSTGKELTEGVGTFSRGDQSKLLAQFSRTMSNVVPVMKNTVIGMTHIQANTSGYGAAYTEKGGNAIIYQVDVKLMAKKVEDWNVDNKQIGQIITWETHCTATGKPPGQTCQSYQRYGSGVDDIAEISTMALDYGLIEQRGAWYVLSYLENHLSEIGETQWDEEVVKKCRYQGNEKLLVGLKENKLYQDLLYKDLMVYS